MNICTIFKEKRDKCIAEVCEDIGKTFEKEIDKENDDGQENNGGQLHVHKELFLNAKAPETFTKLKDVILRKAARQPDWGKRLPLKWLPLEDAISTRQKQNVNVLPIFGEGSLDQINKALGVSLTQDELEVYLKYKHCLGHLLYFPDRLLRENVILNQVWLIHALKSLVFDKKFATDDRKKTAFSNMKLNGIVTDEDRKEIWSQLQNLELMRHSDHALRLMEKLDMITRPKCYRNGEVVDLPYYFVPCMVKKETSKIDIEDLPVDTTTRFSFEEGFLPSVAFNRLLTSCLGLWPVHEDKLFSGSCILRLDTTHKMLLILQRNTIVISIKHELHHRWTSKCLFKNITDFCIESLDRIVDTYGLAKRSTKWYTVEPDQKEVM